MNTEKTLRIAVADDEADTRLFFQELLPHLGHQVVSVAETGRQVLAQCRTTRPDLVITDIKMPDMDGLQAAAEVNREARVPVILVTAHHEGDVLARTGEDYIMGYLAKPIKPVDLQVAVRMAIIRFETMQTLVREAADLRKALEDRKLIERAKGIIMKRLGVDEEEAFRRLRKLASNQNHKLVDVAQQVAAAEEVFRQMDHSLFPEKAPGKAALHRPRPAP